jgi:hypothetical protein
MTRYTPLWQQAGAYPASVDRGLLTTLWPTSGSTGAAPALVTNTMQVSVAPGTAAVALATAAGTELCRWDAAELVTLTAAPPGGQSRVDLVVLQVRDATLDAGSNNDFVFAAVTGVPAASNPAVPATPTNAYKLCEVTVPGGAANLNSATLTDRRSPLANLISAFPVGVDAWPSWVPAWTNFTPGAASITAKYMKIGRTVFYRIRVTLSGSTMGTDPTFSLPVAAAASYVPIAGQGDSIGDVRIADAGIADYSGQCFLQTATTVAPKVGSASGAFTAFVGIFPGQPMTWGDGDVLMCWGTYEAAS